MKEIILDILGCPSCFSEQGLRLEASEELKGDVISGELKCKSCGKVFQIKEGIAYLLPESVMEIGTSQSLYESQRMLSSYLWSHYADTFGDSEACDAYPAWAYHVPEVSGFALDAGCAVGRFSFELSQKCDFVIGLDYSRSFINTARKLLVEGHLEFPLVEEGNMVTKKKITLADRWNLQKVEFIVADAMKPPFKKGVFSVVSTLNLVDKLSRPLDHLIEISRVAKERDAYLIFSDPFSWSEEVTPEEFWLGGTETGRFKGYGLDNVKRIVTGADGYISPPWHIEAEGDLWWKIRNHRNHFELIRSAYLRCHRF